ncbi:MAG TPA: cellulase family glycosylhydrolase [Bacteroidales bacterium]|nr:cellulase family glycosylhydrolase [Bacteroidales bacterium]
MKAFLITVALLYSFSLTHAQFSRGVNLTGWFQASAPQKIQFKKYTKTDFENIKSLGCDVIRLPINLFYMTGGKPGYSIDPLFYDFLDQAVSWAEDLNMYLIIDNHSTDDIASKNPDLENALSKVWQQMAEHYKNRSSFILYEVMNEPNGITTQNWGRIQQTAINAIRNADTTHTIVVGASAYNGYNDLQLLPAYTDKKLIYTFHFYDPFLFTHQGASWPVPSMEPLTRIPFPYNADSIQALPQVLAGTWLQSAYNNYPVDGTVAKVKQLIDIAAAFKTNRHVPVYCGEFGVYNLNSKSAERTYWYGEVMKYLEEKGISWTTWDYQGGFGLFKKGTGEMFDYDLDTALVRVLGLNVPEQKEYQMIPDTTGMILYDDYIGEKIIESGYANGGTISFYFSNMPNNGKYCIYWTGSGQYGTIGFNLAPDRDFSTLVSENYALSFLVRGNTAGTKFDVRFTDTKTSASDHPWRMNYTITESKAPWDGKWHKIYIPLKNFVDQGSYDNGTWYPSAGAFDWKAVDKFEFVAEQGSMAGKNVFFDNITITNQDTAQVFVFVSAITVTGENGSDSITTVGGTLQMLATVEPSDAAIKTVSWSVNDTSLAIIDQNGLLTARKEGIVTVSALAEDGSGIQGSTTVIISFPVITGVNTENGHDVMIYPVPVNNGVLHITHNMGSVVDISVYNVFGQQLLRQQSDQTVISFDVSRLSPGSYILKVACNNTVTTFKFAIINKYQ